MEGKAHRSHRIIALRVWMREAIVRLAQLLLGAQVFDIPPLLFLRNYIYRNIFDGQDGLLVGSRCMFIVPHALSGASLRMGRDVKINKNVEIDYSGGVIIGDDVWISQNVLIETHDHIPVRLPKVEWKITRSPLSIEDGVWIGANVVILESVNRIGRGSVIAAGAVVTRDVGEYDIVAGVPARVIGIVGDG